MLDAPPAGVGVDHRVGLPRVGQGLVVGTGEQGHVAAVEQGQVGDDELDGVGGLQDHERALGEVELVGSSGDLVGEVAAGHLPIALDERHGRRRDRRGAARPTPVHPSARRSL